MTLGRGRVVRAKEARGAVCASAGPVVARDAWGKRVAREVAEAHAEARRIVTRAEEQGREIVLRATREGNEEAARALGTMAAEEGARFAARYLALRAEDERRMERDQERAIAVAIALAERIVGRAIALDPSLVADLARRAVGEARGARRIVIEAAAADVQTLRGHLGTLGMPPEAIELRESSTLGRGDLCLHTDLGTLHARITTQLERLAEALRDVLRQR